MVHGLCLGRKPGHENLCFPSKVAAAGNERYLLCAAGASSGCSCVRSSMRFLKLWLQIALEWLHECCMGFLGQEAAARHLVFPCKVTAAGDGRCLVCVAAGFLYLFLLRLLQRVVVPVCVVLCGS